MAIAVVLHQSEIDAIAKSSAGPFAADLMRRGRKVQNRAKQLVRVDTGRLRSSITVTLVRVGDDLAVHIGTNVVYGDYLEHGTRRMPAYPFLGPALAAAFE